MDDDKLYIPANVKTRLEFFKGFGIKEMIVTVIVAIFSLPVCLLINAFKNSTSAVLFFLIFISATIMSLAKDENNLSLLSQVKYLIVNIKMQKKYKYEYYDKRGEFIE